MTRALLAASIANTLSTGDDLPGARRDDPGRAAMSRSLLAGSWQALARPPLLVPVGLAAALPLLAYRVLDDGYATQVLLGVAMILACVLAASADDPAHEVAAASPYPRSVRCAARLMVGLGLATPIAILALLLAEHQAAEIRFGGTALQAAAFLAVGPAVGFGVWAWTDITQATHVATVAVLCVCLGMWAIPDTWAVVGIQPWGPPWEAVLIRWGALVLFALAVVVAAWRDPLAQR
jgi:hypothetical protein